MAIISDTDLQNFALAAQSFCRYVDNFSKSASPHDFTSLQAILIDLYRRGLKLTDVDLPEEDSVEIPRQSNEEWESIYYKFSLLPYPEYQTLINSSDQSDQQRRINFSDDMGDIYRDLIAGVLYYERGDKIEACFEWHMFFEHWGEHVLSALQALHYNKNIITED